MAIDFYKNIASLCYCITILWYIIIYIGANSLFCESIRKSYGW